MGKRVAILAITATLSAPAFSETNINCENTAKLAEYVMSQRQSGERTEDLIRDVQSQLGLLKTTQERQQHLQYWGRQMVLRAYEVPKRITDEGKADVTRTFRNSVYTSCATR